MQSKLRQFKIHIILGVFFVLIIPISYLGIHKLLDKIVDNIATKQKLQVEKEIFLSNSKEIYNLKKSVKYIEDNSKKIDILKDDSDSTNTKLYGELEKIALRTGNSKISISLPTYPKKNAKVNKNFVIGPASSNFSYITIKMVGTFNDSMNFLHALDNMHYISDVVSMTIERPKKVEGKKLKDEIDRYGGEKLVKSKFDIVFYLKTNIKDKKNSKSKTPNPNVNMKLVEQRKKIALPER